MLNGSVKLSIVWISLSVFWRARSILNIDPDQAVTSAELWLVMKATFIFQLDSYSLRSLMPEGRLKARFSQQTPAMFLPTDASKVNICSSAQALHA
jgi:hypothetical protein